jgi:hypothetical protein
MNYGDSSFTVSMRVGIDFAWSPWVAHLVWPGYRYTLCVLRHAYFQIFYLTLSLCNMYPAIADGDSGRIISSIILSFHGFDQDGAELAFSPI